MTILKYRIETLYKIFETFPCYMTKTARESEITYSHVVKLINGFEQAKLITTTRHGRKRQVELTDKGTLLRDAIRAVKKVDEV